MVPDLIAAHYLDGYRIELRFADGKRGVLDMRGHRFRGVFAPLQDIEVFKSFRFDPELATIVWSTGADLAPEFLYEQAVP